MAEQAVDKKFQSQPSVVLATALNNNAQKDLAEAKTAQACVDTAIKAEEHGLKVKLPKVCDKYIQQKVQSTISFPVSAPSRDKDGGGLNN